MTPLKTRILLADDHAVVRQGLRFVLDAQPDLQVVAEAADGADAVKRAGPADAHLAVLDVAMPRMTGLQAAAVLTERDPAAEGGDALDVRQRAVPVRSAPSGRLGIRAASPQRIATWSGPAAPPCAASRSSTRPRSRR